MNALRRVEARELATKPWFGVGIGFCVLMVLALSTEQDDSSFRETIESLPYLAHPLVGMTVVASYRNATRIDRDGVGELFDTCPTTSGTRTLGGLASSWVPVAVLATVFGGYVAAGGAFSDVHGEPGSAAVPVVLAGLVLGAGGIALGVALGHWARFALAPVLAVPVVAGSSVPATLPEGATS